MEPHVIHLYDVETWSLLARVHANLEWHPHNAYLLPADRRTLVLVQHREDGIGPSCSTIQCWDIPPHKPLRLVLGIPLCGFAMLVAIRVAWRRWQHRRLSENNPKPPPQGGQP